VTHWLRDISLLLGGQLTSLLGTSIASYAVVWYVTLKTGSGTQYALMIIASQLTMGLMALIGGVWSDRYWRKALIMTADALTALATMGLAIYFLRGHDNLSLIVALLAFRGLMSGVRTPAIGASVPQLVPTERLMRVNSLNGAAQSVIALGAPAIAMVMLIHVPLGLIFIVDATASTLAVLLMILVHLPRVTHEPTPEIVVAAKPTGLRSYTHEMGQAIVTLRSHPGLLRMVAVMAFFVCVVVPVAQMTPVFITRYFGAEPWKLSTGEICWSAGMVAGGLIMMAWGGLRNRSTMITWVAIFWAVMAAAMGASPNLLIFCVVMVLWGASLSMLNASAVTAAQEQVAPSLIGRVMGLINLVLNVSGPIGMAVFGPLSDIFSLRVLCLTVGGAGIVFMLAIRLKSGPAAPLLAPTRDRPRDPEIAPFLG